jgi:hypothetical protein
VDGRLLHRGLSSEVSVRTSSRLVQPSACGTHRALIHERRSDAVVRTRPDRIVPAVGRHRCDVTENNVGRRVRGRHQERLALELHASAVTQVYSSASSLRYGARSTG